MADEEQEVVQQPATEVAQTGVPAEPVVETQQVTPVTPATPVTPVTPVNTPVTHTVVQSGDPVGNAYAASQLIQTIVWSVVVLILLAIAIFLLIHYGIL